MVDACAESINTAATHSDGVCPPDCADHVITVHDDIGIKSFHGVLLSEVSTENSTHAHSAPLKPRWLEMELYRFTDGTHRYLVHLVGKSVIYHIQGAGCDTGVPTPLSELPEDGEACPICTPPSISVMDELATPPLASLEQDYNTVYTGDGPHGLLEEMEKRRPKNFPSGRLSAPAQRLLDLAAQKDPELKDAMETEEWL
jgi:hypothetical protein